MKNSYYGFWTRLLVFLIINFGALYLGAMLQGPGPSAAWYQDLNIAPWTPEGWVFGAAWTLIMICFSICLAAVGDKLNWRRFGPIFFIQFVLNVAWNPVFFRYHQVLMALVVLLALLVVVCVIAVKCFGCQRGPSLLMSPYIVWLGIALSLNAYVLLNN